MEGPPVAMLRVLVVDDYADCAQSLATLLRLWGYEVAVARDGIQALEVASAFVPHVVLLDLMMPKLDGYEVARRLKGRAVVIAVTGLSDPASRRRSHGAGFARYLIKPTDMTQLQQILTQVQQWRARAVTPAAAIQQAQEVHCRSQMARSRAIQLQEKSMVLRQKSKALVRQLLDRPTPTTGQGKP